MELLPMGPQPRELLHNDSSLFESLGIVFYEALFDNDFQMPQLNAPKSFSKTYIITYKL